MGKPDYVNLICAGCHRPFKKPRKYYEWSKKWRQTKDDCFYHDMKCRYEHQELKFIRVRTLGITFSKIVEVTEKPDEQNK